ncbi:MAG: hypothetical protein AAGN46_09895 [Acidobacteriota bacterium]
MRKILLAAALLCTVCGAATAESPSTAPSPHAHEIEVYNGSYANQAGDGFVPVQQGPITIHLSSPEHELRVLSNQIALSEPREDGSWRADVRARLEGEGDLIARIEGAGEPQTYEDRVRVGQQWIYAAARVRIRPATADGRFSGYDIEVVEPLQPVVRIFLRSELASQLVTTCRGLASLALGLLDCDALSASLAAVEVPMPAAGTVYTVLDTGFSPADHDFFDRHLAP